MCDKTFFEVGVWFMSIGATLILTSISIGSTIYYQQKIPIAIGEPINEIKLKF